MAVIPLIGMPYTNMIKQILTLMIGILLLVSMISADIGLTAESYEKDSKELIYKPEVKSFEYGNIVCNGVKCKIDVKINNITQVPFYTAQKKYVREPVYNKTDKTKIIGYKGTYADKTTKQLEEEFNKRKLDLQTKYSTSEIKISQPVWTLKSAFASYFDAIKGVFR